MKLVWPICFSLLIVFPQWINTGLLVNYRVHKDYYAQYLCINVDKPELECHGSCHLSKQLEAGDTSDSEKENPVFFSEPLLFVQKYSFEFFSFDQHIVAHTLHRESMAQFSPLLATPPPEFL